MVEDLNGVKRRRVSCPLDFNSPSKDNSVVCPLPDAGPGLSSQETHRSFSLQPVTGPTASQQPKYVPEMQENQSEVHRQSPYSSAVSPESTQSLSVSPGDKCNPSRKRPALTSVEAQLVSSYATNPRSKDPVQAKCARNSPQPISQPSAESAFKSTPVNPAETSTSPTDTEPGHVKGKRAFSADHFASLKELLKKIKSGELVPGKGTFTCFENPSKSNVEQRPKHPSSAKLLDVVVSGEASVNSGCENQQVRPNDTSLHSPKNLSFARYSHTGNLFPKDTDARENCSILPSACTAPQQSSVWYQSKLENVGQLKESSVPSTATNHNTGPIPQPQGNTETDSTEVCLLPIHSIVTVRPDPIKQRVLSEYTELDHSEVNKGDDFLCSLSTVTSSSDTAAAAQGGFGQYSQMVYATTRPPGYLSSEAVASYTAPTPQAYAESLYHRDGYIANGMLPSLQSFGHQVTNQVHPGWMLQLQQIMMSQQQYSSWTNSVQPGWQSDQ